MGISLGYGAISIERIAGEIEFCRRLKHRSHILRSLHLAERSHEASSRHTHRTNFCRAFESSTDSSQRVELQRSRPRNVSRLRAWRSFPGDRRKLESSLHLGGPRGGRMVENGGASELRAVV